MYFYKPYFVAFIYQDSVYGYRLVDMCKYINVTKYVDMVC